MDIDFKQMITAFLLCMAIMWGWLYMTGQLDPKPEPQTQQATAPDQSTPAGGVDQIAPATDKTSTISAVPTTGWKLLSVTTLSEDVAMGSRSSKPVAPGA